MHGIVKDVDAGIVGYVDQLGPTWHHMKEYTQKDGPVFDAEALAVLDFPVAKVPVSLSTTGEVIPDMFVLVREDKSLILHPQTVTGEYTIFPNSLFVERIHADLLANNPDVTIESAGTLFGGRICFVNIMLDVFQYNGDLSKTVVRLMLSNAYGGRAVTACLHRTRIVCYNTLRMAEAQGEADDLLRKFRHTKTVRGRVQSAAMALAGIRDAERASRAAIEALTVQPMTTVEVTNFLATLIPIPEDAGQKMTTRRQNKRDAVEALFATAPDLQGGIARTRYAMLQAVTNWTQHGTIPEDSEEVDSAFTFHEVATGGQRDFINQQALSLLTADTIAAPVTV